MAVDGVENWAAITATTLVILLGIIGNAGNILVLLVYRKCPRLQSWQNAYHVSMAVANIMGIDISAFSFFIIVWMTDISSSIYRVACHILPVVMIPTYAVLASHVGLAILRCYKLYYVVYVPGRSIMCIGLALTWLTGMAIWIHFVFTNTGIVYKDQCGYAGAMRDTSAIYTSNAIIGMAAVGLLLSYILTFCKLRASRRQIDQAKRRTNKVEPLKKPSGVTCNNTSEAEEEQEDEEKEESQNEEKSTVPNEVVTPPAETGEAGNADIAQKHDDNLTTVVIHHAPPNECDITEEDQQAIESGEKMNVRFECIENQKKSNVIKVAAQEDASGCSYDVGATASQRRGINIVTPPCSKSLGHNEAVKQTKDKPQSVKFNNDLAHHVAVSNLLQLVAFTLCYGGLLLGTNIGPRIGMNTSHDTIFFAFVYLAFSLNPIIYGCRTEEFKDFIRGLMQN